MLARDFISRHRTGRRTPVNFLLLTLLLVTPLTGCAELARLAADQHSAGHKEGKNGGGDPVGDAFNHGAAAGALLLPVNPVAGGALLVGSIIGGAVWGAVKKGQELKRVKTLWEGHDRAQAKSSNPPAPVTVAAPAEAPTLRAAA